MKIKQFNQELDENLTTIWKNMQARAAAKKVAKTAKKDSITQLYGKDKINSVNKMLEQLKKIAYGFYLGVKYNEDPTRIASMLKQYQTLLTQINSSYEKFFPPKEHKAGSEFAGDSKTYGSEYMATTESLIQEDETEDFALQNIKYLLDKYTRLFAIMKQTTPSNPNSVKQFIKAYNNLDKPLGEPVTKPKLAKPSVEDFESGKTEEPKTTSPENIDKQVEKIKSKFTSDQWESLEDLIKEGTKTSKMYEYFSKYTIIKNKNLSDFNEFFLKVREDTADINGKFNTISNFINNLRNINDKEKTGLLDIIKKYLIDNLNESEILKK